MIKKTIYVEGYLRYTPSKIEKALEDRLSFNGIRLNSPLKLNYDIFLIERNVGNEKYSIQYKRNCEHLILEKKINKIKRIYINEKGLYPLILATEMLKPQNANDTIVLNTNLDAIGGVIVLHFRKNKIFDMAYDCAESWAIPLLRKAFKNYTGKEFPDGIPTGDNLVKYLIHVKEPKPLADKRKALKESGVEVVNMMVDEFAPYLKSS